MSDSGATYRDSGVDIDAGEAAVERIKPLVASTNRSGVVGGIGGFGGLFDVRAAGYENPLLVSATDGVGTKALVATAAARFDTIGIDLVAMCVDDLVCHGAEPLFFLDYIPDFDRGLTRFEFTRQPGTPLLFFGFAALSLGLCLVFWTRKAPPDPA